MHQSSGMFLTWRINEILKIYGERYIHWRNHFFHFVVCLIFNFPLICRISAKISIDQWKVISMKNQPENEKSEYHNLINYVLFFRHSTNVVKNFTHKGNSFMHFCLNFYIQTIYNGEWKAWAKAGGWVKIEFCFLSNL